MPQNGVIDIIMHVAINTINNVMDPPPLVDSENAHFMKQRGKLLFDFSWFFS